MSKFLKLTVFILILLSSISLSVIAAKLYFSKDTQESQILGAETNSFALVSCKQGQILKQSSNNIWQCSDNFSTKDVAVGNGLSNIGGSLSLIQCGKGQIIKANDNGVFQCADEQQGKEYTGSNGIVINGTTISAVTGTTSGTLVSGDDARLNERVKSIVAGNGLVTSGSVDMPTISLRNDCNTNEILKWNGADWQCAMDNNTIGSYTAGSGIDITGLTISNTGVLMINSQTGNVTLTTDDIPEGLNLYYTDDRARAAFSAAGYINYDSVNGEFSLYTIDATNGLTNYVQTTNGGTGLMVAPNLNDILIGNGGGGYSLATLTAGSGINILNSSGVLTISNTGLAGNGTLNYVAKFTPDGSTVGDSQIFDNGTNVGIGTNTPGGKLNVVQTAGGGSTLNNILSSLNINSSGYGVIKGISSTANYSGSGIISGLTGLNSEVSTLNSGSNVNFLRGISSTSTVAAGSTAAMVNLLNVGSVNNGIIDDLRAIHITDLRNGSGTFTGSTYAIFQQGTNDISMFRGKVGMGDISNGIPKAMLDVRGRVNTTPIGTFTLGSPKHMAVQNDFAYVVDTFGNFHVVDLSNKSGPNEVGGFITGTSGGGKIVVSGKYAYFTHYPDNNVISVFDISAPNVPTPVSDFTLGGSEGTYNLAIQGKYLYVTNLTSTTSNLQVFDVSDPSDIKSISILDLNAAPYGIFIKDSHAYLVGNNNLYVVSIADPYAPTLISTTATASGPVDVYVQDNYAYVANQTAGSIQVFNIADKGSPSLVGTGVSVAGIDDIEVHGNLGYFTRSSGGVKSFNTFDASNPASIPFIGGGNTIGSSSNDTNFQVVGKNLYTILDNDTPDFKIYNLDGGYIQQLEAGGIEAETLRLRNEFTGLSGVFTGSLTVGQSLNVVGGISARSLAAFHIKGLGNTPSALGGTGAGSPGSIITTGTDTAGKISFTSGGSPSTNSTIVTVTFATPYKTAPNIVFSPLTAAAGTTGVHVGTVTTTSFTLVSGSSALPGSTLIEYSYQVIE